MELMSPKNQSSLKARLYVKFQGKKMLELSQVGLYHVMSACLIVSLSTQSSDMVMNSFSSTKPSLLLSKKNKLSLILIVIILLDLGDFYINKF